MIASHGRHRADFLELLADTPHPVTALLLFDDAVDRDPAIAAWLEVQPPALGAIARLWFASMRQCGPDVRELLHDGFATVCVRRAPFAYVAAFRAHVNIGVFHGAALADPASMLQGTGKAMRHVKVIPGHPLNVVALTALITTAYVDVQRRRPDDG